ncbi:MAG: hypothetical protein AKCLJLPJ_02076 [Fimbriimonadales bacterium]|nr:hypothetical protein [Fimbriimonadales bacterium]
MVENESVGQAGATGGSGQRQLAYQEAAAAARHHDLLLWTMTSILMAAQAVLLTTGLSQNLSESVKAWVGTFGILLAVATLVFAESFRSYKEHFYRILKGEGKSGGGLEGDALGEFKVHRSLSEPNDSKGLKKFLDLLWLTVVAAFRALLGLWGPQKAGEYPQMPLYRILHLAVIATWVFISFIAEGPPGSRSQVTVVQQVHDDSSRESRVYEATEECPPRDVPTK